MLSCQKKLDFSVLLWPEMAYLYSTHSHSNTLDFNNIQNYSMTEILKP